jgi:hypothetical protein
MMQNGIKYLKTRILVFKQFPLAFFGGIGFELRASHLLGRCSQAVIMEEITHTKQVEPELLWSKGKGRLKHCFIDSIPILCLPFHLPSSLPLDTLLENP